jgi:hypothetical protein
VHSRCRVDRIATGAVGQAVADAVIIPLRTGALVLPQEREDAIGRWPKTAHVAQAK